MNDINTIKKEDKTEVQSSTLSLTCHTSTVTREKSITDTQPVFSSLTAVDNSIVNCKTSGLKSCDELKVDANNMDVLQIMEWKDGIGTLPGSDFKFRVDEFGHLDMINDDEVEQTVKKPKLEEPSESRVDSSSEALSSDSGVSRTCINCGKKGLLQNFIRQGRFCSKSCATSQSTHLKLFTQKNASSFLLKDNDKKKFQTKKIETIKVRKLVGDKNDKTLIGHQADQNLIDAEMEIMDEVNDEVEDIESQTGNYNESQNGASSLIGGKFSWRLYLSQTNSIAAPIKCFNDTQSFPIIKHNFKVGMKMEGIDPQHQSKFCVLSIAEINGYRLRLHFDEYKDLFDFWVNADSPFIFPAGWCDKTDRKLEPPFGMERDDFNWNTYLQQTRSIAAPKSLFAVCSSQQSITPNGFRIGMKLEAVDRANTALVCVATIADIIGNWLLIHFDGWDDSYDYWAETTSPYIHAINWCRTKGRSLTPPKDYHKSSERFSWEEYLTETKSVAVSSRSFKTRAPNNFKVGMKLEVVDKRNPRLIRVATITHRQSHCIKIHFDNWDEKYDYWVDDDSPDIHPVNWCQKSAHLLQIPPNSDHLSKKDDVSLCATVGCNGLGHIRGPKYLTHCSVNQCPYTDSRLDYELPDRLGNSSVRDSDGKEAFIADNTDDPRASPCPSESNSLNSTQRTQKATKAQNLVGNKPGKRKNLSTGNSPTNNTNGSISPSAGSTRPSTPSSETNLSSLQQSIFAMRLNQQQQEAPICWQRHSKIALPGIDQTKSKDVLLWPSVKVAEFIDSIPGCLNVGQIFQDELIDGEAFLLLNQNDIVKILGLKLGPAIKIYNSILVIRDNSLNEV